MSNQVYSNDTTKYPVDASQLPSTVVTTDTAQSISGQKTLTSQLAIVNSGNGANNIRITNDLSSSSNSISFFSTAQGIAQFGVNPQNNDTFIETFSGSDLKFNTNFTERLRISSTGIPTNNGISNILGLNGTTLSQKTDLVDLSSGQNLSNKTIVNLVATGNITSVYSAKRITTYLPIQNTVGAVTTNLAVVSVPTNTNIIVNALITGYCTASTIGDTGKYVSYAATYMTNNVAGVLTNATITTNNVRSGAFGGAVISITTSGTSFILQATGIANDTIAWSGEIYTVYQ